MNARYLKLDGGASEFSECVGLQVLGTPMQG